MFIYPRISKDVESLLALAGWLAGWLGDVFVPRVFLEEGWGGLGVSRGWTGRRLKGKTLSVRNMTDELCEISSAPRPGPAQL